MDAGRYIGNRDWRGLDFGFFAFSIGGRYPRRNFEGQPEHIYDAWVPDR